MLGEVTLFIHFFFFNVFPQLTTESSQPCLVLLSSTWQHVTSHYNSQIHTLLLKFANISRADCSRKKEIAEKALMQNAKLSFTFPAKFAAESWWLAAGDSVLGFGKKKKKTGKKVQLLSRSRWGTNARDLVPILEWRASLVRHDALVKAWSHKNIIQTSDGSRNK